jgi:signal transduction histidine kinase
VASDTALVEPADDVSGGSIRELVANTLSIRPDAPVKRAVQLFEDAPDADAIAVVGADEPRLLSRARFFLKLGRRFGYALFENREVSLLAEEAASVDAGADPVAVIALALERPPARIYDDIIVVDDRAFCGLVSMRALMAHHKDLLAASIAERGLLERRAQALQEINRLQSEFMSNMTHELRTPINTILGLVELLRSADDALLGASRQRVELLGSRARELLGIVNNVLDRYRLDAGAMQPLIEDVELQPLLEEALQAAEPLAVGKPVRLLLRLEALPRWFRTDPAFVRRIVTNLLGNAVKFTEAGTVTLEAQADAASLTIHVRDTGIGIRPADRERLFARFTQLESTKSKRHAGTGLGLSIVKSLVDALGGTIAVSSQLGSGAVFRVSLPVHGG